MVAFASFGLESRRVYCVLNSLRKGASLSLVSAYLADGPRVFLVVDLLGFVFLWPVIFNVYLPYFVKNVEKSCQELEFLLS